MKSEKSKSVENILPRFVLSEKNNCALRTIDSYEILLQTFMQDIYVVCPSCLKQAIVRSPPYEYFVSNREEIRLICTKCGFNKRFNEHPEPLMPPRLQGRVLADLTKMSECLDPYFHLPLWLSTSCAGHVLWAYNYVHIDFLKKHVEAKLRERNIEEIRNKSLGSRLPKWMTSKKNREAVLKGFSDLLKK